MFVLIWKPETDWLSLDFADYYEDNYIGRLLAFISMNVFDDEPNDFKTSHKNKVAVQVQLEFGVFCLKKSSHVQDFFFYLSVYHYLYQKNLTRT